MAETFFYFHPADNVAASATVSWSSGTAVTDYPVTNATAFTQEVLAFPALIEETSGILLGDFGSAQRADLVMLWLNGDEGLDVFFEMNATDVWTSPTVLTSVTMPAKRADGFVRKVFIDLRSVSGYSTGGFRFFRIRIQSANSEAIGLKFMIFDRIRQLPDDFQWGVADTQHAVGITMKTDVGYRWTYDLESAPRSLKGSLLKTDAAAELVREWVRAAAGGVKLVGVIPEPEQAVPDFWLCYLSVDGFQLQQPAVTVFSHGTTREFTDVNRLVIGIEEAAHGAPEWT